MFFFKKIISQFTIKDVTKVQLIITGGCCSLVSFIFTALHGMQTRSSDENSVCLSVSLSVRHMREL